MPRNKALSAIINHIFNQPNRSQFVAECVISFDFGIASGFFGLLVFVDVGRVHSWSRTITIEMKTFTYQKLLGCTPQTALDPSPFPAKHNVLPGAAFRPSVRTFTGAWPSSVVYVKTCAWNAVRSLLVSPHVDAVQQD